MTLGELGQKLRQKREEQGLTIADVAEKIKVSSRILNQIEEGNQRGLPHTVYARGFIVSYALLLDYDQDELHADLSQVFPPNSMDELQPQASSTSPMPSTGMGRRFFFAIIVLALLGGIAYGGWMLVDNYGIVIIEAVKKPFSAMSNSPEGNTLLVNNSTAVQQPILNSSDDAPATINLSPQLAAPVPSTSASRDASSAQIAEQQSVVTAPATNILEILIKGGDSWVSYEADSATKVEKRYGSGSHLRLPYIDSMKIIIGNPSVVSLVHNGEPYTKPLDRSRRAVLQFP